MAAASLDGISCATCRHHDCTGEQGKLGQFELDGETITRCPLTYADAETAMFLRLHGHYKNGFLLVAGGIGDQPSRYLRAMEILDAVVFEFEEEERKRREREMRRGR